MSCHTESMNITKQQENMSLPQQNRPMCPQTGTDIVNTGAGLIPRSLISGRS